MTMMSSGLKWLQEQRHLHMTKDVYIGYDLSTAKSIKGTVASSVANSTQEGITKQNQQFVIICRTSDVNTTRIVRGIQIWVLDPTSHESQVGQLYEVALQGNNYFEYNDPDHNDVMLYVVLKNNNCKNPFNKSC